VYQAVLVVLIGVVLYAFLKARRERLGQAQAPAASNAAGESSAGLPT